MHLHNPQLAKPLKHISVHPAQPVVLKPLVAAHHLNGLLEVLAHKGDEVDLVHGVRVQQVALADILGGLGLGGVVGLGRPVERAGGS